MFGWLVFSCILSSFMEHQVHAKLMHKKNFLSGRTDKFKRVFEAHAIVHHGHYSKIFSDEPVPPGEDKEIRLNVRKGPMKILPFIVLVALVSWQGALILFATAIFHHWVWNKIHLEMHKPEEKAWSKWPIYQFLARHHWLHHRYPNKNFNVVFPFADYVLGTNAKPTPEDLALMKEQLAAGRVEAPVKVEEEKQRTLVGSSK